MQHFGTFVICLIVVFCILIFTIWIIMLCFCGYSSQLRQRLRRRNCQQQQYKEQQQRSSSASDISCCWLDKEISIISKDNIIIDNMNKGNNDKYYNIKIDMECSSTEDLTNYYYNENAVVGITTADNTTTTTTTTSSNKNTTTITKTILSVPTNRSNDNDDYNSVNEKMSISSYF